MRLPIVLMTTLGLTHGAFAEPRLDPPSSGRIALALDRLGVVGTVLYVAAHPDDENTRLLAWLANARGLRAVYLSMTRGDGGQNLVGPELGPLLGVIRTHELLRARGIDGAEQLFTRAVDFGYSKSADETLAIWGHDEVLADVVAAVRATRPDVIMTRFSIDPPNHGHHTASAMLAREAFVAAGDPSRFPAQIAAGLAPHRAARLYENKSSWRFKEGEDLTRYLAVDVGGFSPELGMSYPELAAESRTMHKSQGFGSAPTYGAAPEYFEPVMPEAWPAPAPGPGQTSAPGPGQDPLAGIDFTWARFPRTEALRAAIDAARKAFDARHPEALVPALVAVRAALSALPDDNPYKDAKRAEVEALLCACAGLVLDARAPSPVAIAGEPLTVTATAVARRPVDVAVALRWPDGAAGEARTLAPNAVDKREARVVPAGPPSTPYWLREPHGPGLFVVTERAGLPNGLFPPIAPPDLAVRFTVTIGGASFEVARPVRYAWVDPVAGERFRAVELLPPVTVTPAAPVRMFPDAKARAVDVRVRAHGAARAGEVRLVLPEGVPGWKVSPASRPFALDAEAEATVTFEVSPPPPSKSPQSLALDVVATLGSAAWDRAELVIEHAHVPTTTLLSAARVRLVPFALKTGGTRIGYLAGAGDDVAASLAQVGYDVTLLDPKTLGEADLGAFAAIVAGIRAYNVAPELKRLHPALMRYVERGGTYLVQYVTSNRQRPLGDVPIGPAPFTIDQGRVTDERAAMTALDPKHPALTTPNAIGADDFAGWIQERGLYFADTWDKAYTPIFAANDPGEKPLQGSVLVMRHGKGAFVYTGLAFFRQLPEGVPGAYRLFANLLALGGRK